MKSLKSRIHNIYSKKETYSDLAIKELLNEFLTLLNNGEIRAAQKDESGKWIVNTWVKEGILLLFKYGQLTDMSIDDNFKFFDKNTLPLKSISLENAIRLVPGGSSIRTGAYLAPGVICMPPMYINIGAYVDEGTMIDSHALVGTCAQVGKNVHLSAASQLGGVLEPPNALPVIIEDDVMIGGNCGIYEGTLVRKRAVIASGVILTSSTKIYDIVNNRIITSDKNTPLEVPEASVVVPGSRAIENEFAKHHGLSIYTPIIVKYRDDKTDAKTALNEILR